MFRKKGRILALLLALLLLLVCVGCGVAKEAPGATAKDSSTNSSTTAPVVDVGPSLEGKFKDVKADFTLKYSLQSPTGINPEFVAAASFRDYVEAETNGKVQIQLYPSAQLGKEREAFEATAGGDIDFCTTADGPIAGYVPQVTVVSIPYLFKSGPVAWEVLSGQFGRELSDLVCEKTGAKVMAISQNGFRCFSSNGKMLRTLEDFKGVKVRTMENQLYVTMVNALGALAVPMPGGDEMYNGLQQHVIDAQENPLDIMYSFRIHEVQDYMIVDNHTFSSAWLCMNEKTFEKLPKDFQMAVSNGAEIWKSMLQGPKEVSSNEAFHQLASCVKEIEVMPDSERVRLKEACQGPVIEWLEKEAGREWIDKILKAVEDAEKVVFE